jgi:acetyltransferase-like isoleucine patch superfamily enzyme
MPAPPDVGENARAGLRPPAVFGRPGPRAKRTDRLHAGTASRVRTRVQRNGDETAPSQIGVAGTPAWPTLGAMLRAEDLFDLSQTEHRDLFRDLVYPWDALRQLAEYIEARVQPILKNRCDGVAYIGDKVYIGEGTLVEDGAMIKGPAIIGRNCRIRHNAYIREHVLIGDNCVVGNACELKHCILFNGAQVPHFNYVGDSILGHRAHLGAGVILSNFRSLPGTIWVEVEGERIDTGLRKLGALVGDFAEVGCQAVLNPGSILGRRAVVYPCVNWRGYLPADRIAKNRAAIEIVERRPAEG